ncbi:PREDICTED: uncharacterized protein LOC109359760 [Lupinus angustifolius]|uniref:uncharacterized protein LOC109359760 n=1 Tax=Lupinus angustifolius TaxID=3871 RepID=UPI00092E3367|nr:PREDICTED: uncharacterized protein LOC109359760 [Lupinus angustifolius]
MAIVLVYVDGIILTGNTIEETSKLKVLLNQTFHIKDLGDFKYFLGFEIARNKTRISINQIKYALEIISDAGLIGCKPSSTPMTNGTHLYQDSSEAYCDAPAYRRLIGRLIYLTNTRPYITFVVHRLTQFMANTTSAHHNTTLKVLRYLKGSPLLASHLSLGNPRNEEQFPEAPMRQNADPWP